MANNPDIADKNILEIIQAIEKTVMDMEFKLEKVHQEMASLRRHVSGIKKGMKRTRKKTEEKHQEINTEMTLMRKKIRGIKKGMKRKFAEIEGKKETNILQGLDMESLRNELLQKYSFRTIPFSPLYEKELLVPLEYFYTEVVIKCVDRENACASISSTKEKIMVKESQEKTITSYKQIFGNGKRIILAGLSGSGKSTFCRKIVNTWCKLQKIKIGIGTDVESSSAHDSSNVAELSTFDTSHVSGTSISDTSQVTGPSALDSSNVVRPSTPASASAIADESVLMKFDLLFYINSPTISDETTLINILCNQCLKREQEREKDEIQNRLSRLLNDQAEQILIIFDGLDEMGHTPNFLVDVFKRELYPGISVLMGMRPWKISKLELFDYDLHLDIQGFSTDNAQKFVQRVIDMNNSKYRKTKEKCLSQKDQEILTSFKNIPLLLLFLANIWYWEDYHPENCNDLYDQIIDLLFRRCIMKPGNKYAITMSREENMDLLLQKFQEKHLGCACKVAYHFLLEVENSHSIVIRQKELTRELGENSDEELEALLDCGIMSKVDYFIPLEKTGSVTFLHMSIQEYLASIYLVKHEDAFQKFLGNIVTLNDILQYYNIFIFISGLDACQAHKAFTRVCEVCDSDTLVTRNRQIKETYVAIMDLNDMYIACINEMNEKELVEMSDIIISDGPDYKRMSRLKPCFARSLTLCLSECEELDLSPLKNLITLKLSSRTMSQKCSKSLSSIGDCICLKNLHLLNIQLHDAVLELTSLTNLTHLILVEVTMCEKCSISLCNSISSFTQLETLYMRKIKLYDGVLDLRYLTNLTELKMDAIMMSKECSRSLCSSISRCTRLAQLYLEKMTLHDGVLDLSSLTNLTNIILDSVAISEECSKSLGSSISGCNHLTSLYLIHIKLKSLTNLIRLIFNEVNMSEECSRFICSSISGLTHLETLMLSSVMLYDGVFDLRSVNASSLPSVTRSKEYSKSPCSSISGCTYLKNLYLGNIKLSDCLLDMISLSKLIHFELDKVSMSEDYSRSLCHLISNFTHLEILYLDDIRLHDGVLDLSSLTKIVCLKLVDVVMSQECSRYLCSSIGRCTHLHKLHLIRIKLHDGVLNLRYLTNLIKLGLDTVTMSEECSRSLCSSISSCTDLENLYLSNITLSDGLLDWTSLTNLIKIRLDTIIMSEKCSRSMCSSVSGLTHLKSLILSTIVLYHGVFDMRSVNASSLPSVTMSEESSKSPCSSISGCTDLENLYLSNITLPDCLFDLRSLTNLIDIRLDKVSMSEDYCRSLCSMISDFIHLENLYMVDITLHDGLLDLSSLTNMDCLKLVDVDMSEECSRSLCSSISGCTRLDKLHLKRIKLHDGVLDLRYLTNLFSLRLDNVTMSEKCSKSLCSTISCCTDLQNLYLSNIKLSNGLLDLRHLNYLFKLRLDTVTMSAECSKYLCRSISNCTHLKELDLSTVILLDGVIDLKALTNMSYLKLLNVTMSVKCSRSLAVSISGCTRLDKLHLKKIKLHDSVLDLNSLTNLTEVELLHVAMSEECNSTLCGSIGRCTLLTQMKLENISLHDGVLDLSSLTNLTELKLLHVTMSEECSSTLCGSIGRCTLLTQMKLENISLHDGVLDLSSLTNLTELKLLHVTMSEECSSTLCGSIGRCTLLTQMKLENISLHDGVLDLSSLTNLTELKLLHVTMSEECSSTLCGSIGRCTLLTQMKLENISLHDGVLDLSSLTDLQLLTLDNVTMLVECCISLYCTISTCTRLLELNLRNITLDDDNMSHDCRSILKLSLKHYHDLLSCDIDSDTDSESDYEDDICLM